jgi:membrane protease YdiL (CAAX protease family)
MHGRKRLSFSRNSFVAEVDTKTATWLEIGVFLVLTAAVSVLAYIPIIRAGTMSGTQSKRAALLMLAPGSAAVITYLIFERTLRPTGWRLGKVQYLLLALIIPAGYCLAGHGLAWLVGWGRYNRQFPSGFPVVLLTLLFNGTLSALLEEIGWRGFLVPKLVEIKSFTSATLIAGLIWALWHYPLIICSDVRLGNTPLPYALICFTAFTVGLSFPLSWLRLKSGSVWTAALLHGSHNAFMLHVFNLLTTDTGRTWLLLGEYGLVTAAIGSILAIFFWTLRRALPERHSFVSRKGRAYT